MYILLRNRFGLFSVLLGLICLSGRAVCSQSRAEQQARAAIEQLIPEGTFISFVREFSVGRRYHLWATVITDRSTSSLPEPSTLVLYRKTRKGFQPTRWCADLGEQHNVAPYFVRMTGRALPEIVMRGMVYNQPELTRYLTIFEFTPKSLHKLLGIASNGDIGIVDLRHDGKHEVVDYGEAGLTPLGVETPHGIKIYSYRNGRFAADHAAFPGVFTRYIRPMEKSLPGEPANFGLIHRVAYFYVLIGKRREAEALYQQAERLCFKELHSLPSVLPPSPETAYSKKLLRSELQQITTRDDALRK